MFVLPRKVKHYTRACAWNSICSVVLSSKVHFSDNLVKKNLYKLFGGATSCQPCSLSLKAHYAFARGLSRTLFTFQKIFSAVNLTLGKVQFPSARVSSQKPETMSREICGLVLFNVAQAPSYWNY